MTVTLSYKGPDGHSLSVVCPINEITVGRDEQCAIRVDDARLSGVHCRVFWEDEACWVEDHGSTNGTYLNSRRVTRERLQNGDTIVCGTKLRIAVQIPPSLPGWSARSSQAEIDGLRHELLDLRREVAAQQSAAQEARHAMDRVIVEAAAGRAALDAEVARLRACSADAARQQEQLGGRLAQAQSELTALDRVNGELRDDCSQLRKQVSVLTSKQEEQRSRINELSAERAAAGSELTATRERLLQRERELGASREERNYAIALAGEHEVVVQHLRDLAETKDQTIQAQEEGLRSLQQRLKEALESERAAREERARLQHERDELRERLSKTLQPTASPAPQPPTKPPVATESATGPLQGTAQALRGEVAEVFLGVAALRRQLGQLEALDERNKGPARNPETAERLMVHLEKLRTLADELCNRPQR